MESGSDRSPIDGEECGVPLCAPSELRADARRNIRRVLEAAARVLTDDPGASMQAIADAAEVSRPTVYRHFTNREELLDAIRLEVMDQALAALDAAAASTETAAAALERLIGDFADIAARYPLLGRLMATRPEAEKGPPERVVKAFAALVARGRRDGTLRPDLRGEILGPATMGALVMSLRAASFRGADPREVGAEVAKFVLSGARAAG